MPELLGRIFSTVLVLQICTKAATINFVHNDTFTIAGLFELEISPYFVHI